jgi:two-component system, OmpR family, alkaline phosphatase synthesis response regulator PhoP
MPKRIFIIEDDEVIRTLLGHILKREGYDVETASSGKDAVDMAIIMEIPPHLVLSDIMMPYLDGFQVVTALRALPGWEHVPMVMLTSKGQEQDIVRALDNGADDYLVKPFQPGELLARLRRFLR